MFFASCVSLHTPSPHFTPAISQKHQSELETSVYLQGISLTAAYSPLNHFLILGAGQSALPFNSSKYQRSAEFGIGYYHTKHNVLFGLNTIAGAGEYNWRYNFLTDSSGHHIQTKGNYQKIALQGFIAVSDNIKYPEWLIGFSVKSNFYRDNLSAITDYGQQRFNLHDGPMSNSTIEPCFFTKNYFGKHLCLNAQVGMNISYDISMFWPTQYMFMRIGLGFRI